MATLIPIHKEGGPEVLKSDEVPDCALQSGEVRLKVEAIGLSRAEILFREGQYLKPAEFPSLIGYEAAGVIQEAGPEVVRLRPGVRAANVPHFQSPLWSCGDSLVLPAKIVVTVP
jgi:NADPH:quinone reductase-like Zn-dependent oxidoreductase